MWSKFWELTFNEKPYLIFTLFYVHRFFIKTLNEERYLGNDYYCGFVIQSDNQIHLTFALNQQTQNSAEWFNSNNDLEFNEQCTFTNTIK